MAAVNRSSSGLDWGNTTPYTTQQDETNAVAIAIKDEPPDDFLAVEVNRESGDFTFTDESAFSDSETPKRSLPLPTAPHFPSPSIKPDEDQKDLSTHDQRQTLPTRQTSNSPPLAAPFSHSQTTPPPLGQTLQPLAPPRAKSPSLEELSGAPLHQRRPSNKGDPAAPPEPSSPVLSASNSSSHLILKDPDHQLNIVEEKPRSSLGKIFDCIRSLCGAFGNKSKNT